VNYLAQNCQTFRAQVLQVTDGDLLVRSCRTGQEILVHTDCACRFSAGDCVRIRFNGVMTMSIPPQITALCIRKIEA
jgi:hypothetical protein